MNIVMDLLTDKFAVFEEDFGPYTFPVDDIFDHLEDFFL
jgi:hypothetical protein